MNASVSTGGGGSGLGKKSKDDVSLYPFIFQLYITIPFISTFRIATSAVFFMQYDRRSVYTKGTFTLIFY